MTGLRARDITERVEAERKLEQVAVTDELTGLLNRRGFLMMAGQEHRLAVRKGVPAALVFADLDGLKKINDGMGHDEGGRAIVDLAGVLRATFRESDVIARLGGDEYAALLYDMDAARPEKVFARLRDGVAARNAAGDRRYVLSASIGSALLVPGTPRSLDELIAEADQDMYERKRARGVARASKG